MTRSLRLMCALAAPFVVACANDPGILVHGGEVFDAGTPITTNFNVSTVATNALYPAEPYSPSVVAAQHGDNLGIAYFATSTVSGFNYDLWYMSWSGGTAGTPERVTSLYLVDGLAITFQPNGQPSVSFLGGDNDPTYDAMPSVFWKNSDSILAERSSNGTWTQYTAAKRGNQAMTIDDDPASNTDSPVVGVYPAVGYDSSSNAYVVYRDVHFGQSVNGDYDGSDMEEADGARSVFSSTPPNPHRFVIGEGGIGKEAWGGQPKMIVAGDVPALVSTQVFQQPTGAGQNVWFTKRSADGTWGALGGAHPSAIGIGNTYSGPSLAYDATVGYGIAVTEHQGTDAVYYVHSVDGSDNSWQGGALDPAFEDGSGGWYPAIAFEPATDYPHILFYFCALTGGVQEGACPADEDELRVTWRTNQRWQYSVVDPDGGAQTSLFFLSTGKRVAVYRAIDSGAVKVAVEQ